jgi:hypothetical protein
MLTPDTSCWCLALTSRSRTMNVANAAGTYGTASKMNVTTKFTW